LAILAHIPPDEALVFYTNNSYLHDGITNWVKGWRKVDWAKPDKFKSEWQALDRHNQSRQIRWVMAKPPNIPEGFESALKLAQERRSRA
jgi:ribonuclease HI